MKNSNIKKLTNVYGRFFGGCVELAIAPYTASLCAFKSSKDRFTDKEFVLGLGLTIFLSTVVPILPAMTSITFTIALFLANLALVSMLVAYPLALIFDVADSHDSSHEFAI